MRLVEEQGGAPLNAGVTYADLIRRGIGISRIQAAFGVLGDVPSDILKSCETEIAYAGYLKRNLAEIEEMRRMEGAPLPPDLDYAALDGLRLEAREKLARIRPLNLGQAARISGVSPADVAVLMVYLSLKK